MAANEASLNPVLKITTLQDLSCCDIMTLNRMHAYRHIRIYVILYHLICCPPPVNMFPYCLKSLAQSVMTSLLS